MVTKPPLDAAYQGDVHFSQRYPDTIGIINAENKWKQFIAVIKDYGRHLGREKLITTINYAIDEFCYISGITAARKTDLDTRTRILDAMAVVGSLDDIDQKERQNVLIALKRRLVTSPKPGFDISAWKPTELYADRKPLPDLGRKENIVEFLQRVWSPVIATGKLPLDLLFRQDTQGYRALFNWKKDHAQQEISLPLVSSRELAASRIEQEASLPSNIRSARTEWALRSRRERQPAP